MNRILLVVLGINSVVRTRGKVFKLVPQQE